MSHDREAIRQFLLRANKAGYGNENTVISQASDGAHVINYVEGTWSFSDTFYGGHPYAGQEVIYCDGAPQWAMQYRGWIFDTKLPSEQVYAFLKKALIRSPEQVPYRGPEEFQHDTWVYRNDWQGELDNFSGAETISLDSHPIYRGLYFGGVVDE